MKNNQLPEGKWTIVAYLLDDEWVPTTQPAELEVTAERFGGTAGVNRLMSSSRTLPMGPMATTMMAGPPEMMDQEQRLLALIGEADGVIHGLSGMFLTKEGLPLVEFVFEGTSEPPSDV